MFCFSEHHSHSWIQFGLFILNLCILKEICRSKIVFLGALLYNNTDYSEFHHIYSLNMQVLVFPVNK